MRISVLIPCFNEEKNVARAIYACLSQSRLPDQILIVNDGSTDSTGTVLSGFGDKVQVVTIGHNSGNKSRAQQEGLKYVTGDVFITTDADSVLDMKFVERVERAFEYPKTSAFAGYVKSSKHNFWTACRELEYVVGQLIHKEAQNRLNALYVIPGCAGAFRTDLFRKYVAFDHDTLTEDLDFTFKLHSLGMKIVYDKMAVCYTQDPGDFTSYTNQMRRWYAGGWQNIRKHKEVLNRPLNTLELALTYVEGLVFSVMLFVIPFLNLNYYLSLMVGYLVFVVVMGIFAAILDRRWDILFYSPLYMMAMYINTFVFLEQFVKEIIFSKRELVWFHPTRRMAV